MTTPKKKTDKLTELGDFLDPILAVPYRGVVYRVQPVDADTGLRLHRILGEGVKAAQGGAVDPANIELVNDQDEQGFFRTVLGDAYQDLIDTGASNPAVKIISSTAFLWHVQGFEAAEQFWAAGGKAPAPNREERRTATRTRPAAASTTRKRA